MPSSNDQHSKFVVNYNIMSTPTELINLLRRLRAVREFDSKPIPDAALQDILEVARWTGSGMNSQPWHLVVVKQPEVLQQIGQSEGYIKFVTHAQAAIVPAVESAADGFDEGRLAERILLAATAHGLGAALGWLQGGGQVSVRTLLNIPANYRVRTVIALGYPTEAALQPKAKPGEARKALAEIVSYEKFGAG